MARFSDVPAEPLIRILLTADGAATVDGQPLPAGPDGRPPADPRAAALAEVRLRAARLNRPVRVVAKEPSGEWPMIVDPQGRVQTLTSPHPVPDSAAPVASVAVAPLPVPPPPPAALPDGDVWVAMAPEVADLVHVVRAQDAAGNLAGACAAARDLEDALVDAYGELHPYAVNARHLRAHLALRSGAWADSTRLHLDVAERRRHLGGDGPEVAMLAHNTMTSWTRIPDRAAALQIADEVIALLETVGFWQLKRARAHLRTLQDSAAAT